MDNRPIRVVHCIGLGLVLLLLVWSALDIHKRQAGAPPQAELSEPMDMLPGVEFVTVALTPPPVTPQPRQKTSAPRPVDEPVSDHRVPGDNDISVKPLQSRPVKIALPLSVRPLLPANKTSNTTKTAEVERSVNPITRPEKETVGQSLLSRLEAGTGPRIEIAWPAQAGERQRLFRVLHQCIGIRLGRLRGKRITALERGGTRQAFSGYVRVINGATTDAEQSVLNTLDRHGLPVRLFPRQFDEQMLNGLAQVSGVPLHGVRRIRGKYRFWENKLTLSGIVVDGRPVKGRIQLVDMHHCSAY